jgi:hypothetical protein
VSRHDFPFGVSVDSDQERCGALGSDGHQYSDVVHLPLAAQGEALGRHEDSRQLVGTEALRRLGRNGPADGGGCPGVGRAQVPGPDDEQNGDDKAGDQGHEQEAAT